MAIKHWVVFPSAMTDRADAAIEVWAARGYLTLIFQDIGSKPCKAHVVKFGAFPGYYRIINSLVEDAFREGADLVTCAADDMRPDKYATAEDVAKIYFEHFKHGEGVMQATGDRQGVDSSGLAAAERICGSPTFGLEWAIRGYEGKGPLHSGYRNYFSDEDILNVAKKHGLLWQEKSLTIDHMHWSWQRSKKMPYHERNSNSSWAIDQKLFFERKAADFPNSGLLALK